MSVRYCLGIHDPELASLARNDDLTQVVERLRLEIKTTTDYWLPQLPSLAWSDRSSKTHLVAQLTFPTHQHAKQFFENLNETGRWRGDFGFGPDPVICDIESWPPIGSGGGIFGNRDVADVLTGTAALSELGATGQGVNVVIVDRGLDRDWVRQLTARMAWRRGLGKVKLPEIVPGWTRLLRSGKSPSERPRYLHPGASGSEHGHMIARNVLAIAPQATLWDAPLLPPDDEPDAPPTPSVASTLFHWIKRDLADKKVRTYDSHNGSFVEVPFEGPCVIVNAWGVLDPESDPDFQGYADDPDHMLVNDIARLDSVDVVFAAGNCGEPCADRRCGRDDCGPGRSVLGVNAHPKVLTVGAVRADGLPIAFSAQGPGRLARRGSRGINDFSNDDRAIRKPDLCAPSHFRESDDGAEVNTGTSAACGFAAGILAALRSLPKGRELTPEEMRSVLRNTARLPNGTDEVWDPRFGHGTINAENAVRDLGY